MVKPRMGIVLLPWGTDDRPEISPANISNIGLVGQFCEMPQYSCVDMSYGERMASGRRIGLYRILTGANIEQGNELSRRRLGAFLKILFWR